MSMTDLEKRAASMKWAPPPPGSQARKEMPSTAFLMPSSRKYPYKLLVDGQWVISVKGLRSVISVANFQGNPIISAKASKILERLLNDKEASHINQVDNILVHFGVKGMRWGVRKAEKARKKEYKKGIKQAKIERRMRKSMASNAADIKYAKSISDPDLVDEWTRGAKELGVRYIANQKGTKVSKLGSADIAAGEKFAMDFLDEWNKKHG